MTPQLNCKDVLSILLIVTETNYPCGPSRLSAEQQRVLKVILTLWSMFAHTPSFLDMFVHLPSFLACMHTCIRTCIVYINSCNIISLADCASEQCCGLVLQISESQTHGNTNSLPEVPYTHCTILLITYCNFICWVALISGEWCAWYKHIIFLCFKAHNLQWSVFVAGCVWTLIFLWMVCSIVEKVVFLISIVGQLPSPQNIKHHAGAALSQGYSVRRVRWMGVKE